MMDLLIKFAIIAGTLSLIAIAISTLYLAQAKHKERCERENLLGTFLKNVEVKEVKKEEDEKK